MKKTAKFLTSALCVTALCGSMAAFAGCGGNGGKDTITITGSTSVEEIMRPLAAEYEKNHEVRIVISAHGSGAGISDTKEGRNDFGMSSRNLKDDEPDALTGRTLCLDGIALVVSKDCTVKEVTNDEVYRLYVSGTAIQSALLSAYGRDSSSGTAEAFNEKICNPETGKSIKDEKASYFKDVQKANTTGSLIDAIKQDRNSKTMGYISLGSYLKETESLKALKFQAKGETEFVEATTENVQNGSYALQRPFVIVTKKDAALSAAAQGFYDWIFTAEARTIIAANGYVLER